MVSGRTSGGVCNKVTLFLRKLLFNKYMNVLEIVCFVGNVS